MSIIKRQRIHFAKRVTSYMVIAFATVGTALLSNTRDAHASTVQASPGKPIVITIRDDGFSPNEITDAMHQTIHLRVHNAGQHVHEFAIPEYRIYTRNLNPGESSDIEFSPWQAGSFVMYSDPTSDSHPEFAGRFIVLPDQDQTSDE